MRNLNSILKRNCLECFGHPYLYQQIEEISKSNNRQKKTNRQTYYRANFLNVFRLFDIATFFLSRSGYFWLDGYKYPKSFTFQTWQICFNISTGTEGINREAEQCMALNSTETSYYQTRTALSCYDTLPFICLEYVGGYTGINYIHYCICNLYSC